MSWNGRGFDKPLIMLDQMTPSEAMARNLYQPDDDVEILITEKMTSEQLIGLLRSKDMLKEACDYMAFCINRRVGVWWAYCCVAAVNDEIKKQLEKSPLSFEEQQKKEVEAKVAEWGDRSELDAIKAQHEVKAASNKELMGKLAGPPLRPNDPLANTQATLNAQLGGDIDGLNYALNEMEQAINALPPKVRMAAQGLVDKVYRDYEVENGIHPMAALKNGITKSIVPSPVPQDNTLRDQYFSTIQNRISQVESYVKGTMDKYFPLKIPGLPKEVSRKKISEALFSVKRWILTPTDANGKLAGDASVPVQQTPEGLCAMSAYWSSSNLMPGVKNPLHPPPGLAANGLANTVFMCAMKKGGSKTYDERYEEYFDLGIDCLSGIKTWDKEWKKKTLHSVKAKPERIEKKLDAAFGFGREC
ncbi:MAG: hypothetical protein GY750_06355 [Lentisphaerae bacterium]|nr:hypothetical protein [Lentisphaerota bacterium]MCP4101030.1 hypothetical protein [Lentisphaerota bacterium]